MDEQESPPSDAEDGTGYISGKELTELLETFFLSQPLQSLPKTDELRQQLIREIQREPEETRSVARPTLTAHLRRLAANGVIFPAYVTNPFRTRFTNVYRVLVHLRGPELREQAEKHQRTSLFQEWFIEDVTARLHRAIGETARVCEAVIPHGFEHDIELECATIDGITSLGAHIRDEILTRREVSQAITRIIAWKRSLSRGDAAY